MYAECLYAHLPQQVHHEAAQLLPALAVSITALGCMRTHSNELGWQPPGILF